MLESVMRWFNERALTEKEISLCKTLRSRPSNGDSQIREYCDTNRIGDDVPKKLQDALEKAFGICLDGVLPSDDVSCLGDGTELGDLHIRLERTFQVRISDADWRLMDGTIGSLMQCVSAAIRTRETI